MIAPSFPLRLAVWLAIVTGFIQALVRFAEQFWLHRNVRGVWPDVLWMAPTSNLVWFGLAGIALSLAVRWLPRILGFDIVAGILAFPVFASVIFLLPKIHEGAALILAAGLAVQSARAASKRAEAVERWMRRGMVWAISLLVVSAFGVFGHRWTRERLAMASLPEGVPDSPNVLLLVLDTVRSFSLSLYGYERPTTPRMEEWARDAVRFDRAFVTAPWTLPSHAGMFTGRYPHELSTTLRHPLDAEYPTLAEALTGAGFATGGFAANLSYCARQFGLARGFVHYEDYPVNRSTFAVSSVIGRKLGGLGTVRRLIGSFDLTDRLSAREMNTNFLTWVDGLDKGRPFFAFINYFDAHFPHLPPAPFDTLFGPRVVQQSFRWNELKFEELSPSEIAVQMAAYEGGIAYLDQQIDLLLKDLQRRGMLDNTVVILTSDHGEHWGDHRRMSHGNSMYRQLLQVPLVIRYPKRLPRGTVVEEAMSLRDLPATVLDLARVENKGRFPGVSFASDATLNPAVTGDHSPILSGSVTLGTPPEGHSLMSEVIQFIRGDAPKVGVRPSLSLIADGMHYIHHKSRAEELYDLERDSLESQNLASTPGGQAALKRLRSVVDSVGETAAGERKIVEREARKRS